MVEGLTQAVVGFAFTDDKQHVLLIRKNRPTFQAGKLNGVGGKVEPGEDTLSSMVREFREETSLFTSPVDWTCVALLESPGWDIHFFKMFMSDELLRWVSSSTPPTDEKLELVPVDSIRNQHTLRNVQWLVPLCLDDSPYELPIKLVEKESR